MPGTEVAVNVLEKFFSSEGCACTDCSVGDTGRAELSEHANNTNAMLAKNPRANDKVFMALPFQCCLCGEILLGLGRTPGRETDREAGRSTASVADVEDNEEEASTRTISPTGWHRMGVGVGSATV
jgi:hypothetical protein